MGRPMEASIHDPSVGGQAATTASSAASSNGTSSREHILALMQRKEILEGEINALSAVLDTVSPPPIISGRPVRLDKIRVWNVVIHLN
ncbi:putative 26S proteasome regulatory subunit [Drechslerella dactyloides]|uniref:26S proteasome regulatory subunit n=1 Tax=Drechslerella dactyloides TaxID=74499 RepID=A0AAD6J4Q8_DREDA|nr:putative 26S proteasome regulatory subunit [Drechslerella dactyloides]